MSTRGTTTAGAVTCGGLSVGDERVYVRECEWCGHSGAGHMFEFSDSKQETNVCQVPVQVRISPGMIIAAPCGCNKTGPKRVKVEPPPLPPPPTCIVCDDFAAPNSSFCSEFCEARAKAFLRDMSPSDKPTPATVSRLPLPELSHDD